VSSPRRFLAACAGAYLLLLGLILAVVFAPHLILPPVAAVAVTSAFLLGLIPRWRQR
jgi:hypothetical protein